MDRRHKIQETQVPRKIHKKEICIQTHKKTEKHQRQRDL